MLIISAAVAGFIAATAVPSFAASGQFASLDDGRVHGFDGCLAQEPSGSVHVNGMYRGHLASDPPAGHIAVKDAQVTGGQCS